MALVHDGAAEVEEDRGALHRFGEEVGDVLSVVRTNGTSISKSSTPLSPFALATNID